MKLDEDSFLLYAAKYYDIRMAASADEFYDDLKRFQHLKRLFKRYEEDDDLKGQIDYQPFDCNLLTVLVQRLRPMLFFKLEDYHKSLKPFVIMLGYMPELVEYRK